MNIMSYTHLNKFSMLLMKIPIYLDSGSYTFASSPPPKKNMGNLERILMSKVVINCRKLPVMILLNLICSGTSSPSSV